MKVNIFKLDEVDASGTFYSGILEMSACQRGHLLSNLLFPLKYVREAWDYGVYAPGRFADGKISDAPLVVEGRLWASGSGRHDYLWGAGEVPFTGESYIARRISSARFQPRFWAVLADWEIIICPMRLLEEILRELHNVIFYQVAGGRVLIACGTVLEIPTISADCPLCAIQQIIEGLADDGVMPNPDYWQGNLSLYRLDVSNLHLPYTSYGEFRLFNHRSVGCYSRPLVRDRIYWRVVRPTIGKIESPEHDVLMVEDDWYLMSHPIPSGGCD